MANNQKKIIESVTFEKALGDRYLAYALSTIMSRSLPDVRDGLKPVHRRLIYAMQQLRLSPNMPFKKCARVVGDVMGKFHPHGDAAIYGALVRLAQDFSLRYPLIEGQGNFGNIDGDNAAAMRYTESRLTNTALLMLEGLNENAVDFKDTYDEQDSEPLVLPARIPNILANGSTGIAVGMATNIPPHNLAELCLASIKLIDMPSSTVDDLLQIIPGPDFPTGGIIVEKMDSIKKAYETGNGSIRLRSRYEVMPIKGGSYKIIVTEIPYMVEKSKLIERIADLLLDKRLPLLGDVMDESSDDIRVVLEPKSKNIDPIVLMESLFKLTDLEVRFAMNLNVLNEHNVPKVMSLKEILESFLKHRQVVLTRRTQHRQDQIVTRLELLDGYLIAYLNIDEVIRIIREEDEPKPIMMNKFILSETQVEAILNMRLRALRKLQEIEIRTEHKNLSEELEKLNLLLSDDKLQWKNIKADLKSIQKIYSLESESGKRRTTFADAPQVEIAAFEEMIEKEDLTLVLSSKNWIRTIKGHDVKDLRYKDGDEARIVMNTNSTEKLVLVATNGKCFTLDIHKLPKVRGGQTGGAGEPLRMMIDLDPKDDVLACFSVDPKSEMKLLLANDTNRGFIVKATELFSSTKNGKQVFAVSDNEKIAFVQIVTGDHVATLGENRKILIFPIDQMPEQSRGRGQVLQKYKQGNLVDILTFNIEDGLTLKRHGNFYVEKNLIPWIGKRNTTGRLVPMGFPRDNKFPRR
ncbi:MAG: DNA topoisomerase IV subunit A [Alphaproteobacteria bacterium CG_4_10_14_0_8_um_filter_37_21]|nr:MAG: DNA topoisomerase IV subunit A [Alphaproteobacteria bacterium CG_4_10_14_0_8_um_filter_37_21]